LGGMGGVEPQHEPHAELITILAGPFVNLLIVLTILPVLVLTAAGMLGLLAPLTPIGLVDGAWWLVTLKTVFWINWLLLIANLLPAFPLDGARIVRAILWPALDYRGACLLAVRASKLAAIGLCIWAWFASEGPGATLVPSWLLLVMLAIFVYFSASHEAARTEQTEWNEELFSYDFSQGYTSLDRSSEPRPRPLSPLQRWISNRRAQRARRRETQEREEECEVDAILTRLHESGMQGLTAKERAILQRVSARYRDRQH
jgi:stage IV sporulation protein FB